MLDYIFFEDILKEGWSFCTISRFYRFNDRGSIAPSSEALVEGETTTVDMQYKKKNLLWIVSGHIEIPINGQTFSPLSDKFVPSFGQ